MSFYFYRHGFLLPWLRHSDVKFSCLQLLQNDVNLVYFDIGDDWLPKSSFVQFNYNSYCQGQVDVSTCPFPFYVTA